LKVNLDRIKNNLYKLGEFGQTNNKGITRLPFTEDYKKAAEYLKCLMESLELKIREDPVGNIFGKKNGTIAEKKKIMFGSHLDTVKNGGLFDGLLGIVAGLECLYTISENDYITNNSLELVAFNAEEGSDLKGTFGSRAIMGLIEIDENYKNILKSYNITPEDIRNSKINVDNIVAFLELHISQEVSLESKNIPIGVVNKISGITRYKVTCYGASDHAGSTFMHNRNDAMIGATKLILKINEIAKNIGGKFVATVGVLKVYPGEISVIPGKVEFLLEIRDTSQERIDSALNEIIKESNKVSENEFEFELIIKTLPMYMNNDLIKRIKNVCELNNLSYDVMTSGAGHDAKSFSHKVPSGLIFVPSKEGLSHCKDEWIEWNYIEKGTQILLDTILDIDNNTEL